MNESDEIIIRDRAINDNSFLPYLSINEEQKGVSNIDEIPNEDIVNPIKVFVYPRLSKKRGSKKKQEKLTKKKQLEKVARRKFLFSPLKYIIVDINLALTKKASQI